MKGTGAWAVIAAVPLLLAAGSAATHRPRAAAASKPLPVFEFKGRTTEETGPTNIADCPDTDGESDCGYENPPMAGTTLEYLHLKFHNQRLYEVLGGFSDWAYPKVRDALGAKYGSPNSVATRKWQNKAGNTFDNVVSIWHFKGGDLELDSMGSTTDTGLFIFISGQNAPPADKPKVDF